MARLVVLAQLYYSHYIRKTRLYAIIAYVFIFLQAISLRVFVNKHKKGYNNDVALVWLYGGFYKESVSEQRRKFNGAEAN